MIHFRKIGIDRANHGNVVLHKSFKNRTVQGVAEKDISIHRKLKQKARIRKKEAWIVCNIHTLVTAVRNGSIQALEKHLPAITGAERSDNSDQAVLPQTGNFSADKSPFGWNHFKTSSVDKQFHCLSHRDVIRSQNLRKFLKPRQFSRQFMLGNIMFQAAAQFIVNRFRHNLPNPGSARFPFLCFQ